MTASRRGEARDFAETARAEFLRSPDVGKVDIFGDQDEKIYLNFSPQKLANLKLNLDDVLTAIAQQNAVVPSGVINTPSENVLVDVTGALLTPEAIAKLNLWVDGRFYKLTDIAEIQHGYSDPPTKMFRVNGKPAIGIGVNMRDGRQQSHLRRGSARGGRAPDAALTGRHRAQARVGPARGRARGDRRASPRPSSRRSPSCSW